MGQERANQSAAQFFTLKLSITLISILMVCFVSGCSSVGSLQFVDKFGHTYQGKFDRFSKEIETDISGVKYSGFFITNAGEIGGVQYTGNTGRAILKSIVGDTMQCEFNYQGIHAIGTCVSASGDSYHVATQ